MRSKPARSVLAALCLVGPAAWAMDYGTVLSSTPVVVPVPTAQRQCVDEPVVVQPQRSGAGALIGAIAGAAVGNAFGSGAGRAAATGLGMVAGAAIGDRVEADGSAPVTTTVQRCRSVTAQENRLIGYDVVYDYQGVRRSVRLAQDPGARIALEVVANPVGALAPAGPAVAPPSSGYITPADTLYDPAPVVYAPPPRVWYAPGPAYVSISPMPYLYYGGVVGAYGWRDGHGAHGGYGRRH